MTTATAPKKLTRQGSRSISVRITDEQWNHLVVQASMRSLSLSDLFRLVIERDIDAQPDLGHEDGSPGVSMRYRAMLGIVDVSGLEELQAEDDASS